MILVIYSLFLWIRAFFEKRGREGDRKEMRKKES